MARDKLRSAKTKTAKPKTLSMIVTGAVIYGADNSEYKVEDFLGRGSFGLVYRVRDAKGGFCAVKTLAAPSNQLDVESFLNEGRLAVGIRHPNVIEYHYFHDGRQHENLPIYILMEYAEGGSLQQSLKNAQAQGRPFTTDALVTMFKQLIAGMTAINDSLVHRDIKPGNILHRGELLKITVFSFGEIGCRGNPRHDLQRRRKLSVHGTGSMAHGQKHNPARYLRSRHGVLRACSVTASVCARDRGSAEVDGSPSVSSRRAAEQTKSSDRNKTLTDHFENGRKEHNGALFRLEQRFEASR